MRSISQPRQARRQIAAILASIAGLLLTHGVAIACLLYCLVINPAQPLLAHHHHHPAPVTDPAAPPPAQPQSWHPDTPASPILSQGAQAPLIVPTVLVILLAVRVTRWTPRFPQPRLASWIAPLPPPPPRHAA